MTSNECSWISNCLRLVFFGCLMASDGCSLDVCWPPMGVLGCLLVSNGCLWLSDCLRWLSVGCLMASSSHPTHGK